MTAESHLPGQPDSLPDSQPTDQASQALDQAAVLQIVRSGQECPPLTDDEIAQAVQRQGAGTLLATIAVDHMLAAAQPVDHSPTAESGFSSYLKYAVVTERLGGVTGSQPIKLDRGRRQELQTAYKAQQAEAQQDAAGFIGLLGVVGRLANELNTEHADADDKLVWLSDLADRAEAANSPLLKALPQTASYGRRYPARREAVTQAGRLLWYIIVKADETAA